MHRMPGRKHVPQRLHTRIASRHTAQGFSGKLCFSLKMRAALFSQGQRSDDRAAFGKRGRIFLEALLSQCIFLLWWSASVSQVEGTCSSSPFMRKVPTGWKFHFSCLHWARFDQTRCHEALGDSQTKTDLLASSSSLLQCPLTWKLLVGDVYMTVPFISLNRYNKQRRGCDCAERFCSKPHLTQNQGYFLPRFPSVCFLVLFIECFNIKRFFLEYWSSGCVWEPCPFHRRFASAQIQRAIC